MKTQQAPAEVNIHLRAKVPELMLIDQAIELLGSNRSQFMAAREVSARLLIADAISLQAETDYRHHGFARLPAETPPLALEPVKFASLSE